MDLQDGAHAIIVWKNKILLFHRDNDPTISSPDCWQLPGGGIEKGETPLKALKRELLEEVSYAPVNLEFLAKVSRKNRENSFVYFSFVDDKQAKFFRLGQDEGQEIEFFTVDEALRLRLTPGIKHYLSTYKETFLEALENKDFSKLRTKVVA